MKFDDMAEGLHYLALEYRSIKATKEKLFRLFKEMIEIAELNKSGEQMYKTDLSYFTSLLNQTELSSRLSDLGVKVWKGLDGEYRLVNIAPPKSNYEAYKFLQQPVPPGCVCRFCFIDENQSREANNIRGTILHPECEYTYRHWKFAAESYAESLFGEAHA